MTKLGKDYNTDLKELHQMMQSLGIEHIYRRHPITETEPVKDVIGYNPTGDYQIIIPGLDWKYSIIRGMVSFGDYEVHDRLEAIRFKTAEEVVGYLKELK